jgi:hypothetical protein
MFEEQARKRYAATVGRPTEIGGKLATDKPDPDSGKKSRDQAAAAAVGVGPVALKPMFEERAKKRQRGGQGGVLLVENVPQAKARDRAAAVGVWPDRAGRGFVESEAAAPFHVAEGYACRCSKADVRGTGAGEAERTWQNTRRYP